MWFSCSEDALAEYNEEVHHGLYATGMTVATFHGLPRLGPVFGDMLISGNQVAKIAIQQYESNILDIEPLATVK